MITLTTAPKKRKKNLVKIRAELEALTTQSQLMAGKISDLTILSYGGGQDSKAILSKLVHDPVFRARYVTGRLIVIMADTGDEHPYTYRDLREVKTICKKAGFEFHFIHKGLGFHTKTWPDLITPQVTNGIKSGHPTMVQLGTKSCTDKLKIQPIYKFLDSWINSQFDYGFKIRADGATGKQALKKFYKENGKIRILIGFAYEEEKRGISSRLLELNTYKKSADLWDKAIYREFPLIDYKLNRASCQKLIASHGYAVPMPSNCQRCPYMSLPELLWLFRNYPAKFHEWAEIETSKLERFNSEPDRFELDKKSGVEYLQPFKNHGVFNSTKTLTDKLFEAFEKFGHWTNEQLDTYKMSHGCNGNAF